MTQPVRLPVFALLSNALVAYTIEFDNEADRRIEHHTTNHGGNRKSVWLVSMAMWFNCMRFVGEDPLRVGELERLARTTTNLDGMRRWGYVTVEADPGDIKKRPARRDLLICATKKGMLARRVWESLFEELQKRWESRFGKTEISKLCNALARFERGLDANLPDCMPILYVGLFTKVMAANQSALPRRGAKSIEASDLALPVLLARLLTAFALEYERDASLSLALSANVLRVLSEEGICVADIPRIAGVSKESVQMALRFLQTRKLVVVETVAMPSRRRVVRLTAKGRGEQENYHRFIHEIEGRWRRRFGSDAITRVRSILERLVGKPSGPSKLIEGLRPHQGGWRAARSMPTALPYFPMVLHRGGYPDGS